ncbi:hypothetical protein HWI79_3596 [Cryptosporidium felis]|nr:hypothetical protein HWI79_3596 [Cryptosporidium felis]
MQKEARIWRLDWVVFGAYPGALKVGFPGRSDVLKPFFGLVESVLDYGTFEEGEPVEGDVTLDVKLDKVVGNGGLFFQLVLRVSRGGKGLKGRESVSDVDCEGVIFGDSGGVYVNAQQNSDLVSEVVQSEVLSALNVHYSLGEPPKSEASGNIQWFFVLVNEMQHEVVLVRDGLNFDIGRPGEPQKVEVDVLGLVRAVVGEDGKNLCGLERHDDAGKDIRQRGIGLSSLDGISNSTAVQSAEPGKQVVDVLGVKEVAEHQFYRLVLGNGVLRLRMNANWGNEGDCLFAHKHPAVNSLLGVVPPAAPKGGDSSRLSGGAEGLWGKPGVGLRGLGLGASLSGPALGSAEVENQVRQDSQPQN